MLQKFWMVTTFIIAMISCSSGDPTAKILNSMNDGDKLVEVNGKSIHQGYLELLTKINPRVKSQIDNPVTKQKLLENLVEQELMYQESLKRGLHKRDDVRQKAALYQRVIISQALLEDELIRKAKEHYDKNKEQEFMKMNLAHIQVNFSKETPSKDPKSKPAEPTDAEKRGALDKIQGIKARLDKGEDFAKLAEELSDDPATKRRGGELGPVAKDDKRLARRGLGELVPVAFSLKKGEISNPIESKKGYHLVKILSDPELTPFEEAEKTIRFQIQQSIKDSLVGELKKSSKIQYTSKTETPAPALAPLGDANPTGVPQPAPGVPP